MHKKKGTGNVRWTTFDVVYLRETEGQLLTSRDIPCLPNSNAGLPKQEVSK
jgi:hypothetical protein